MTMSKFMRAVTGVVTNASMAANFSGDPNFKECFAVELALPACNLGENAFKIGPDFFLRDDLNELSPPDDKSISDIILEARALWEPYLKTHINPTKPVDSEDESRVLGVEDESSENDSSEVLEPPAEPLIKPKSQEPARFRIFSFWGNEEDLLTRLSMHEFFKSWKTNTPGLEEIAVIVPGLTETRGKAPPQGPTTNLNGPSLGIGDIFTIAHLDDVIPNFSEDASPYLKSILSVDGSNPTQHWPPEILSDNRNGFPYVSDLVRLTLLAEIGGVWLDASSIFGERSGRRLAEIWFDNDESDLALEHTTLPVKEDSEFSIEFDRFASWFCLAKFAKDPFFLYLRELHELVTRDARLLLQVKNKENDVVPGAICRDDEKTRALFCDIVQENAELIEERLRLREVQEGNFRLDKPKNPYHIKEFRFQFLHKKVHMCHYDYLGTVLIPFVYLRDNSNFCGSVTPELIKLASQSEGGSDSDEKNRGVVAWLSEPTEFFVGDSGPEGSLNLFAGSFPTGLCTLRSHGPKCTNWVDVYSASGTESDTLKLCNTITDLNKFGFREALKNFRVFNVRGQRSSKLKEHLRETGASGLDSRFYRGHGFGLAIGPDWSPGARLWFLELFLELLTGRSSSSFAGEESEELLNFSRHTYDYAKGCLHIKFTQGGLLFKHLEARILAGGFEKKGFSDSFEFINWMLCDLSSGLFEITESVLAEIFAGRIAGINVYLQAPVKISGDIYLDSGCYSVVRKRSESKTSSVSPVEGDKKSCFFCCACREKGFDVVGPSTNITSNLNLFTLIRDAAELPEGEEIHFTISQGDLLSKKNKFNFRRLYGNFYDPHWYGENNRHFLTEKSLAEDRRNMAKRYMS